MPLLDNPNKDRQLHIEMRLMPLDNQCHARFHAQESLISF